MRGNGTAGADPPPLSRAIDEVYIFRVENGRLAGATAVVEDPLTRGRQLGFEL